jgi:alpha-1,6-mannosyltransferase
MLNVSASLAASRLYNNRKKTGWNFLYILMLGAFLVSLGYSSVSFAASYSNYPGGHGLKALHEGDSSVKEKMVHIDAFTAMSGVSRFCENEYPWRYSKEEDIPIEEYQNRNFTYLLNEHRYISGYKCLFAVEGFSRAKIQPRFPPLSLVRYQPHRQHTSFTPMSCSVRHLYSLPVSLSLSAPISGSAR